MKTINQEGLYFILKLIPLLTPIQCLATDLNYCQELIVIVNNISKIISYKINIL